MADELDRRRLLHEIGRLRGELEAIVHVCRGQCVRVVDKPFDPAVQIIESIAIEALRDHRDRRPPEDR